MRMTADRDTLSVAERNALLIRRPWTADERRVVFRGFWGRASIAIEPILGAVVFFIISIGMLVRAHAVAGDPAPNGGIPAMMPLCVAAIFGLGCMAFVGYAFGVMAAPVRALYETSKPIWIVDGYIRFRGVDERSAEGTNGYVAVLTEDRRVACEWETHGEGSLDAALRAALVEFSEFGGIHRIDGAPTGVLPEEIAPLGIGIARGRPR